LVAATVDLGKIIIGQLTPLLLYLTAELLPITLNAIPIHHNAPFRWFITHAGALVKRLNCFGVPCSDSLDGDFENLALIALFCGRWLGAAWALFRRIARLHRGNRFAHSVRGGVLCALCLHLRNGLVHPIGWWMLGVRRGL